VSNGAARCPDHIATIATMGIDLGKNSVPIVGLNRRRAAELVTRASKRGSCHAAREAVQRPPLKFSQTAARLELAALRRCANGWSGSTCRLMRMQGALISVMARSPSTLQSGAG
jgi:hypothetical protein